MASPELDAIHQELQDLSAALDELMPRITLLNNERVRLDAAGDKAGLRAVWSQLQPLVDEGEPLAKRYKALVERHNAICPGEQTGWTRRTHGTMENGEEVTFREGRGLNSGHTLISDGTKSNREFRREHNHYGPNRENGGYVEEDRGHYTGPDH